MGARERPRSGSPQASRGVSDSFEGYVAHSAEALLMFVVEGGPKALVSRFRVGVATYSRWSERHLPQIELLAGNPSEDLCPVRGGKL